MISDNQTFQAIDTAIQVLQSHKEEWSELSVSEYLTFADDISQAITDCAEEWVRLDQQNRGIDVEHWDAYTSYFAGPIIALRETRNYQRSLSDIIKFGKPRYPGPVKTVNNHQLSIGVFPTDIYDKILYSGLTSEIWFEPGVTQNDIPAIQAVRYDDKPFNPGVSLILSAGNVSCLTVNDVLFKLFNERHVVLIKTHPVLKYTEVTFKKIFKSLIDRGFLQVITGEIPETTYVTQHAGIDAVHMTGSDKTFEALLYGTGEEGKQNKAARRPKLNKKIYGELGNVSPLIIIPGPWTDSELAYQARNIASSMVPYGGFYCLTSRVIIQHAGWALRNPLLEKLRAVLAAIPSSVAHYPGAHQRIQTMIERHPEAEQYGKASDKETPWTFVANLPHDNPDEICFNTECFGSFCAETAIPANSVAEYIDKAVEFCNQTLWGTLTAMIIVHPKSLEDETVRAAFERAKATLRYGTICINQPSYLSFLISTNIWGAYPGAPDHDIQSGNIHVNNAMMFEKTQKTITSGPFKVTPTPAWFPDNKKTPAIVKNLLSFEEKNSVWNLMKVLYAAIF